MGLTISAWQGRRTLAKTRESFKKGERAVVWLFSPVTDMDDRSERSCCHGLVEAQTVPDARQIRGRSESLTLIQAKNGHFFFAKLGSRRCEAPTAASQVNIVEFEWPWRSSTYMLCAQCLHSAQM